MILNSILKYGFRVARGRELKIDPKISDLILLEIFMRRLMQLVRGFLFGLLYFRISVLFCGRRVRIRFPSRVRIGSWTFLDDEVVLDGFGREGIQIGKNCSIGAYTRIAVSCTIDELGVGIKIGDGVGMGEFSRIGGAGGVTIGEHTIAGQYLSIHPENHVFDIPDRLIKDQGVVRKPIHIGRNCWIGAKVTVLSGATIGDNCVVAAGAVVTKSFPANSIIGGVPAKIIGSVPSRMYRAGEGG